MTNSTIGVDVSKDRLDAHRLPDGAVKQFPNDAAGHKALIRWIKTTDVERIVFEATGYYSRAMELALVGAGLPVVKVNPRQARRFAEAIGKQVKTDAVDAAMLARMGKALDLAPPPPPNPNIIPLKELLLIRRSLIKDQTAARNRLPIISSPVAKQMIERRLQQIKDDIATIDAEIARQIDADAGLAKRIAIIASIPGIGKVTAAFLVIEMPELGSIDHKAVASLAGLAPVTKQSGTWKGKARISGGRRFLRQALYMPAVVAICHNAPLKLLYRRLVDAGKPPKAAITAVMRKLLTFANARLAEGKPWAEKSACA